ncbi:hemerythrin domain-containing protein [Mycobacterium sp. 21AC1]|uniref:hemerythrin domain-containing protein n=1 Tax=[Mycobacterium] appelbergii TaxID=2939269 RepID=UPI0029394B8A|nr:hemerythrin domain-containing protein [Mycobacterium sp. 21AC1]MDV3126617.1 hemerythrin domain-containing protein [Mycobacterium sp. 21AC1]
MDTPMQPTRLARTTARNPGDAEPDLTGITLAHRAMVTDVGRVAALTTAFADGRRTCAPNQARAVARYVALLCDSIHHHHTTEDQVLWPVIESVTSNSVDLTELTEDHAALDPELDRLRELSAGFRLNFGNAESAAPLAAGLAHLHTLLHEHIADEEREIFPVIRRYVAADDWAAVEKAAQRAGRMSFDGPRTLAVMTDNERIRLSENVSPVLIGLIKLLSMRHRRFDRRVFG